MNSHMNMFKTETDLRVPRSYRVIKPCTIMLVDDDQDDREFAIRKFNRSRHVRDVKALPSGVDLISYMKEEGFYDHSVIRYNPLLIVLDMHMPKMNGLEVIEDIRSDNFMKEIPIVILSSQNDRKTVLEAYKSGANGYLHKPLNVRNIERYLPQAWQWPPEELW